MKTLTPIKIIFGLLAIGFIAVCILFALPPTYNSRELRQAFTFDFIKSDGITAWCFTDYDTCNVHARYLGTMAEYLQLVEQLGLTALEANDYNNIAWLPRMSSVAKEQLSVSFDGNYMLYHRDLGSTEHERNFIASIFTNGIIHVCATGSKEALLILTKRTNE